MVELRPPVREMSRPTKMKMFCSANCSWVATEPTHSMLATLGLGKEDEMKHTLGLIQWLNSGCSRSSLSPMGSKTKWPSDSGAQHLEEPTFQVHTEKSWGLVTNSNWLHTARGRGTLGYFCFPHANLLEKALQSPGSC